MFSDNVANSEIDDICIQGIKDDNSVWRFHDGTNMPGFLGQYMEESRSFGENNLRYKISTTKLVDRKPNYDYSFVCEYRFKKLFGHLLYHVMYIRIMYILSV